MQPTYPKGGPQRFIYPRDVVKVTIGYVRFDKLAESHYVVMLMSYSEEDLNKNAVGAVMNAKVDKLQLQIKSRGLDKNGDPMHWDLKSGPTATISTHDTFSEAAVAVTKLTLMDWLVVDKEESAGS
jgi:hypothetical protein